MTRDPRERESREYGLVPRSFFRFPSFPNLWEDLGNKVGELVGYEANTGISISEDDQNVYVEANLPGLKNDNIDISINKNTLWIKGEKKEEEENKEKKFYRRAQNSFFYQVELPSQVEENTEQAEFEDGVLKITFKKTRQSQVRKIPLSGKSFHKNHK